MRVSPGVPPAFGMVTRRADDYAEGGAPVGPRSSSGGSALVAASGQVASAAWSASCARTVSPREVFHDPRTKSGALGASLGRTSVYKAQYVTALPNEVRSHSL